MNCSMDTSQVMQCDDCQSNVLCSGIGEMPTASPAGEKLAVQLVLRADLWRKILVCFQGK